MALLFAAVPVLGAGAATLFVLFVMTFPWENTEPYRPAAVIAAVAGCALGLVLPAVLCWILLAVSRLGWARLAFAAQALLALVALAFALSESEHSDGRLLAYVVPVELCGLLAVSIRPGL